MFSTIVLASIALASAQRAGQQDPALLQSELTHIGDNTAASDGVANRNGDISQNAIVGLFVGDELGEEKGKFVALQSAGIDLRDEDGKFIDQDFLGAFVANEPCAQVSQRRNGRGIRFAFNNNDRGANAQNLRGEVLQLFNQRTVNHKAVAGDILQGLDHRFDSIRNLRDENVQKLVDAKPSVILFQQNNINNQLFCLDLVDLATVRANPDLADLEELVVFQEGTFAGFRVQDIVMTCDDKGKLEEIERGWGGVAGFGVFERDVPNPIDVNEELTGTTLLIDGIQVTQWEARHYGNYEAVVSAQECNKNQKGKDIVALEIDNRELRIRDINLNEDNWVQGKKLSNIAKGHESNNEDQDQENAVSQGRVEQGSLRNAILGSVRQDAKGMFLVFNDKAVACCDLIDVNDVEDVVKDHEINIDFLNDVAEDADTEVQNNWDGHHDGHHAPPAHHDGGYGSPPHHDADSDVEDSDDISEEDSATSMLFSVGAAALALVAFL